MGRCVASYAPQVHSAAVIKLHTIPGRPDLELESYSPFCMKAEVYLALAGLPYEADRVGDPRKAPKGKLPWIEDDGAVVADSGAIIAHLEKKHGGLLDKGLDERQRAIAHVVARTLEESLYFVMLWSRWAEPEGWQKVSSHFFDTLPAPLRLFIPGIVRKKVIGSARAQGIGRHTRDEIYEHGKKDFAAVAEILGDKPFLTGDAVRSVDVSLYAFTSNVAKVDLSTPVAEFVKKESRLMRHMERVGEALAKKKKAAAA
jgi:glutathione S-transferase